MCAKLVLEGETGVAGGQKVLQWLGFCPTSGKNRVSLKEAGISLNSYSIDSDRGGTYFLGWPRGGGEG